MQDPTSGRVGLAKNLTLDQEAVEMLETLALGKHAQGRLLAELIRREALRREERARLKAAVLAVFEGDEADAAAPEAER